MEAEGAPSPGLRGPLGRRAGGSGGGGERLQARGPGRSHLAREPHLAGRAGGQASERAGRLGAPPRSPAPPGTLGSAGRGRAAPTHKQRGAQPSSAGAAGEPAARSGVGGLRGRDGGFAPRASRRGQWPELDDRCGGAAGARAQDRWSRREPGSLRRRLPGSRAGGVPSTRFCLRPKHTAGEAEPARVAAPAAPPPSSFCSAPSGPSPKRQRSPGCVGAPPPSSPSRAALAAPGRGQFSKSVSQRFDGCGFSLGANGCFTK